MNGGAKYVIALAASLALTGASCPRRVVPVGPMAPVVFQAQPTVAQIVQVVNQNTQRIQQLETVGASINVQGAPALRTSLAMERPFRLRLQAGTGITGNELDAGSNDDLFWFWTRRAEPPAVYYARHDQAFDPRVQSVMPISPHWFFEAMGLVYLDPQAVYEGPFPRGPNRLELRYVEPNPTGPVTKVLVVDSQRGQIEQLAIYNAQGLLVASANASNFQYDPAQAAWLPRQIDVQLPLAQLNLTLLVDQYAINQLTGDPNQLWTMPTIPGFPPVNLVD